MRRDPSWDPSARYNGTTYFVWAGDQLLWEIREAPDAGVEHAHGMVSYFQAGGIDRPLTIWKEGIGTVVTHQNWRGQFARGTFGKGTRAGESSDCTEYPATNGCIPVRWPGWNTTAWSQEASVSAGPLAASGSVTDHGQTGTVGYSIGSPGAVAGVSVTKAYTVGDALTALFNWAKPGLDRLTLPPKQP